MILAFFIYTGIYSTLGKPGLPIEQVAGIYVPEGSLLENVGFKTDDKIVGVNGNYVDAFEELISISELTNRNLSYQVVREGITIDLFMPTTFLDSLQQKNFIGYYNVYLPIISSISLGSPAEDAGLQSGDRFVEVNGEPVNYWEQVTQAIRGTEGVIDFVVEREGQRLTLSIEPYENRTIGINTSLAQAGATSAQLSFGESIIEGWEQVGEQTMGIIGGFSRMFSGDISIRQNIGGPIAIADLTKQAVDQNGWLGFWQITALLSITLAIMNILPIPALDGGHLVFLIYEGIARKEPTEKVKIAAQNIGFLLLVSLMVFVIFNDVLRLF